MPYPKGISTIDTTSLTRNEARKLRRLELKKYQAYEVIAKFEGTSLDQLFSPEPTRYLCLTNLCFGGVGGVTTEQVPKIFNTFDGLTGTRLTHGKPYSFALFNSTASASYAREFLHNKPCELLSGKVLFIEYVNLMCQSFMKQIKDSNEVTIPGLILLEEFVPVELEKSILQELYSNTAWIPVQDRSVLHFGYSFNYDSNEVGLPSLQFPPYVNSLLEKLKKLYPFISNMEQLTIQHYPIGIGIPPHVDSHSSFGSIVLAFSLESPVIMEFKNLQTGVVINIDLPERSLMILKDEARYAWSHAIRARKSDLLEDGRVRERNQRVSLTLRTVNPERICHCKWPDLCDHNIVHLKKDS
ncbi:alkylated DNA repair protein alkB-like 8 isoform X1 [Gigaspora margarita]|uniref:Alkylated DNA repair protein alkB-like 8 isoform X1 n=1 Tax=Gigaspora margarita TaxID=4874 RepID=A0A8H3WY32_GIGMA|nr:alkylated DNA repair protein alkB-like 8 isoform X1 [Gigaspora margarita]